jgi:hypothetical protein
LREERQQDRRREERQDIHKVHPSTRLRVKRGSR